MTGSQSTTTRESRRLTTGGLIAVTVATLLMMAWVILAPSALATVPWNGNGVTNGELNSVQCDEQNTPYLFWVFTGSPGQGLTDVTLTVNGQTFDMDQAGGGNGAWQATTPFFALDSITASVDGVDGVLTLSHGCPGETTTTDTTTTETTTTETTTSSTTATTTTPGTTTTTPAGTSTTTESPTVSPTTVTPSETTDIPTVNPTTVQPPGETAFTGPEDVVPIGALALMLLTTGSGLLWAGSRRRREGMQDQ